MSKALTTKQTTPVFTGHVAHIDSMQRILMQTLEGVANGTIALAQAKVITGLVQTSFNGAKIESDHLRATQRTRSTFFDPQRVPGAAPQLTSDVEPQRAPATVWRGLGK